MYISNIIQHCPTLSNTISQLCPVLSLYWLAKLHRQWNKILNAPGEAPVVRAHHGVGVHRPW